MSLTLVEARSRATALSDVSYAVDLDLTDPAADRFGCRTTVRFTSTASETFLELTAATDVEVVLDGTVVAAAYDGRRLHLTGLGGAHVVTVSARLPFVTDGEGMHRTVDPADGETYLGAYLGLDVAQRLFACFDQNDLKAPVAISVAADPSWTVLANGRTVSEGGGRWEFAPTPPIPVALVCVVAGPWRSVRWEHAGLPFGWHARASLAAELARDADELRAVTEACFDHYAEIFHEPYPFDSFDQVFVPGLNWGAQEQPGCVIYRDEMLPVGRVPQDLRLLRASVVAHEMAHMWFGDLVTMTWWEDSWLQESFADYLGYRVAEEAAGYAGALLGHEVGRKPAAYHADERRSTHPVAAHPEDVPDVAAAATIFDSISYAKGNSVLRQLVTWLGDETFLRGVNTYLTRHRFANATLADFVAALDEASDRDVRAWVEVWLRQSGFDTIRVERDGDVPVLHRDGVRPHRFRVTALDGTSAYVDLADDPVPLPAMAGLAVVPNSHGETFARIVLDEQSWDAVAAGLSGIDDDLTRGVLWTMLFDRVQTRDLDPLTFLDLVSRHLPAERTPSLVTTIVGRTLGRVLPLRVPNEAAAGARARIAAACATPTDDADLALAFAGGLAATEPDPARLRSMLGSLTPALRWRAVRRLAETSAADAEFIEAERLRSPGLDAELGAAAALAARPTEHAKADAWAVVSDPEVGNRVLTTVLGGLWSPEQADLVAPYVDRYLREAPAWSARGAGFAQVVGQARPTLLLTDAQRALLHEQLAGELPTVLRRQWSDWADDLAGTRQRTR
ncbi:aminopeptidase N [Nocardioides sp. SR21]|uniref:aminopeptidase N n=1 Tax=Nocardioides sp. SR21 TaxID=2919501 RepID=UPI001FAA55CA|nr:aminopeptidase N [Nocardioides sp. SR21]